MALDQQAADLYGLPIEEFTAARDALVRRLREEDRRDEAAEVAKLRKPTTDAWALDQVARRHPEQVEGLVEAHRALREARDGNAFRDASDGRRRIIDELIAAAASVLDEAGHSSGGTVEDRIARTLLAAAADPDTEEALRRGTLTRPTEISAEWPQTMLVPPPTGAEEPDPAWEQELERLEAEAEKLTTEAERLREQAKQARDALDRARQESETAERAAREAEATARAAREEAKAAGRRRPRSS